MNTLTKDAAATLEKLEQAFAALPDPRDVPLTFREQEEDARVRSSLSNRISGIRNGAQTLAELDEKIAAREKWLKHLTQWRRELVQELVSTTPPPGDSRLQAVKLAISNIDRGCEYYGSMCVVSMVLVEKIRAVGYVPKLGELSVWSAGFGSLPQTEVELIDLRNERADAQVRFDAALAG